MQFFEQKHLLNQKITYEDYMLVTGIGHISAAVVSQNRITNLTVAENNEMIN